MLQEAKKRFEYYAPIDFFKMMCHIIKNKTLALMSNIYPSFGCYSIRNVIKKYGLKVHETNSVNSKGFIDHVKSNQIDLIISIASPKIFKKGILQAPKKGCINYHTALLPKYRGRQPLFWAMLNDEKEVGISIHEMDEKLDNGPIIA